MIRVLNRDPELLKQQANVSAPLPTKPVEEKPYVRKFQPVEVEESKAQTVEAQPHDYGVGHKMTGSEGNVIFRSVDVCYKKKTK